MAGRNEPFDDESRGTDATRIRTSARGRHEIGTLGPATRSSGVGHHSGVSLAARPADSLRQGARTLVVFYLLAVGLSWPIWFALVISGGDGSHPVLLLATFGPAIAAMAVRFWTEGRAALRSVWHQVSDWRFPLGWYAYALLAPLALAGAALLFAPLLGIDVPPFGTSFIPAGLAAPVVALMLAPAVITSAVLGGPLGEEIGWRGFALPRMVSGMQPLAAALLLGGLWAAYHLPLFWIAGTTQSNMPPVTFALWVIALSVHLAWSFFGSRQKLLVSVLLHASVNVSAGLFGLLPTAASPSAAPFTLYGVLTAICAVPFAASLARSRRQWRGPSDDVSVSDGAP